MSAATGVDDKARVRCGRDWWDAQGRSSQVIDRGKRVHVDGEIARVVHVDLLRVVLMTEPQDGDPAHRLVVSQDDWIDLQVLDEQGKECV
jgi:hypothetical protein